MVKKEKIDTLTTLLSESRQHGGTYIQNFSTLIMERKQIVKIHKSSSFFKGFVLVLLAILVFF